MSKQYDSTIDTADYLQGIFRELLADGFIDKFYYAQYMKVTAMMIEADEVDNTVIKVDFTKKKVISEETVEKPDNV